MLFPFCQVINNGCCNTSIFPTMVRDVAHALRSETAIAVSNGSLKLGMGTAAFIVVTQHASFLIIQAHDVPGSVNDGASLCSADSPDSTALSLWWHVWFSSLTFLQVAYMWHATTNKQCKSSNQTLSQILNKPTLISSLPLFSPSQISSLVDM